MANINLAANSFESEKKLSSYNKVLVLIVVFLVILAGAYLWIYFTTKSVVEKTKMANSQYDLEYASFIGGSNKDVMDFQNRITVAKDLLGQKNPGFGILPAIEAAMVQGIYLKLMDFDKSKNSIRIRGVTDNFDMMARQILSFKQSNFFSGVSTGATNLDENGKVNFELSLSIK